MANNLINTKELLEILAQSLKANQTLIYSKESISKDIQLLISIIDELKANIKMQTKRKEKSIDEIVKEENPKFETNNLILTPNGSDKIMLMKNILLKGQTGKILILTSDIAITNSIRSKNNEKYEIYSNNDIKYLYNKSYEICIMSYTEFGSKIKYNNKFVEDIKQIYCDEVHSLVMYKKFSNSMEFAIAMKYLFEKHENKQIFYFTATDYNLRLLEKEEKDIFRNIKTFNYLDHPEIKQYMVLSKYKIHRLEQIREHLQAKKRSFNYFGYKCLAFNRTISGQKKIEAIAIEEGFRPIALWSINNTNFPMNEEQLRVRDHLLTYGEIPEPYNFLIINSAMQEGWNLSDDMIKLAIMNTTNETEKIQALGRHRDDLDILIYKVTEDEEMDILINLQPQYLNKYLTSADKEELCVKLNLIDIYGRMRKWRAISAILKNQGYIIEDKLVTLEGKRTRASIITTQL